LNFASKFSQNQIFSSPNFAVLDDDLMIFQQEVGWGEKMDGKCTLNCLLLTKKLFEDFFLFKNFCPKNKSQIWGQKQC